MLHPVPTAYERLKQDQQGRYRFLGYVIEAGSLRLSQRRLHSLRQPGRHGSRAGTGVGAPAGERARRRARGAGIPGNFTLDEVIALCAETGIASLISHHFALFAFNTVDPTAIDVAAARQATLGLRPGLLRPDTRHASFLRQKAQDS